MINDSKKMRLACVFIFLLAFACLFAQESGTGDAASVTDEKAIYLDAAPAVQSDAAKASTPSSFWILVRVVLVLALVCAGIYGVIYLLKKSSGGKAGNDPYVKNIASLYFSPNKSVQVISLGTRAYLVGVTEQNINLIAEVEDRELIDAMNLQSDRKNPVPTGNFQSVLSNFIPGLVKPGEARDKKAKDEGSESFAGTDFLRTQRERLQRSGRQDGSEE